MCVCGGGGGGRGSSEWFPFFDDPAACQKKKKKSEEVLNAIHVKDIEKVKLEFRYCVILIIAEKTTVVFFLARGMKFLETEV